jgi:hypothetical protein
VLRISLDLVSGPLWLYVAILLGSILVAIWSYRHTIPRTTTARRNTLIVLRSLGLAALLFAIFQPILSSTTTEKIAPSIALVMDNSESMTLPEKGHVAAAGVAMRRDAMIGSVHAGIANDVLKDSSKLSLFTVGDRTNPFPNTTSIDSIRAQSSATDLSSAFRTIRDARSGKNIGAIILYTDGSFTAGENPIYPAEALGLPVYAVGLGDSTEPRDLSLTQLFTNEVGSIGAEQPVDITVHYGGVKPGEHVTIELFEEGTKIDEKQLELKQAVGDEAISFAYKPATEGTKKLTARISEVGGEATSKNNLRIAYVKVLKNKFHVVLFAGAPSSDVSFLRQFFSENPALELSTYIQKQGADFYEGAPTREKLGQVDLVVLSGFPIASTSNESISLVKQLLTKESRSLLYLPSRQVDVAKLNDLGDALPFRIDSRTAGANELKTGLLLNPSASDNPVLRIPPDQRGKISWEGLAPLFKTETHFAARPESQTLAEATVQGLKLNEPLIISRHIGNARQLALTGYGIWQWKLITFGREAAFTGKKDTSHLNALDLFLSNATRWLTTEEETKRVRIEPNRRFYQAGERIDFFAQVYDESYTPVDRAEVTVKVSGSAMPKPLDLTFQPVGNGRYVTTILQGLPKGDYAYAGSAGLNGRTLGSDDGRFNVGDFNVELAETRMRSDILRPLAERTGGKFYTPENAANVLKDIYNNPRFQTREVTNKKDFELWNSWPLLLLAILFFATEWFIRKRLGML